MKYYVVSDVHGFYSILKDTLEKQGYFTDPVPHKLIICGDIFDRGDEAVQMQQFVLDLMEKDEVILVKGNHEVLAEEFLNDAGYYLSDRLTAVRSHHAHNGTLGTFLQLLDVSLGKACQDPDDVAVRGKRTPYVSKIIPAMRNYYETKNYVFTHAWLPTKKISDTRVAIEDNWRDLPEEYWTEQALWLNGITCHKYGAYIPNKTIVCGHYHASFGHYLSGNAPSEWDEGAIFTPYYARGIIAIDACTAHTKTINCIVVEDEELME